MSGVFDFGHTSKVARGIIYVAVKVLLCVSVVSCRVCCACGKWPSCIGACGGCEGSSHCICLTVVGGRIPLMPSVPGDFGAVWCAPCPRCFIVCDVVIWESTFDGARGAYSRSYGEGVVLEYAGMGDVVILCVMYG